jgi:hypothetical protein
MTTGRPKQHHYVPRFYLERFVDNEGHVWVFDKVTEKVFATTPSKLARESGFYDAPALGTHVDQTAIEHMLAALARIIHEVVDCGASVWSSVSWRHVARGTTPTMTCATSNRVWTMVTTGAHR